MNHELRCFNAHDDYRNLGAPFTFLRSDDGLFLKRNDEKGFVNDAHRPFQSHSQRSKTIAKWACLPFRWFHYLRNIPVSPESTLPEDFYLAVSLGFLIYYSL